MKKTLCLKILASEWYNSNVHMMLLLYEIMVCSYQNQ